MSITVGTPTAGNYYSTPGGSTFLFAHTVGSGTTVLVYMHTVHMSNSSTAIDWVEWNGTRMVRAKGSYTGGQDVGIWYLNNPAVGSYDITAHWSGGGNPDSDYMACVDLSSSIGIRLGDTQTSTAENPSVSYTLVGSAGYIFDACVSTNTQATVGAGQTAIYDNQNLTYMRGGSSYKSHSGSATLSYTTGTGGAINYAGAEFYEKEPFVPQITII